MTTPIDHHFPACDPFGAPEAITSVEKFVGGAWFSPRVTGSGCRKRPPAGKSAGGTG